jgi:hypothetical protein
VRTALVLGIAPILLGCSPPAASDANMLRGIVKDCKVAGHTLEIDRKGFARLKLLPNVRMLPLSKSQISCVERLVKERLGRKLIYGLSSSSAAESNTSFQPGRYLIFEFPDGVRGGFGRIWGDLPPGSGAKIVSVWKICKAVDPTFMSVWSHSGHVVTVSTRNDFTIVECIKRNTSNHFNVWIGSDPTLRSLAATAKDSSQFKSLENNPNRERLR